MNQNFDTPSTFFYQAVIRAKELILQFFELKIPR